MYFEIERPTIEKAAMGDISCFEKIVVIYEKMIYNICYKYSGNEEDAKDIAQEVFIKIYRNLMKYNFSCKFSTWAHKIAVNSSIDFLRKKKSRQPSVEITEAIENESGKERISQSPADLVILKESLGNIEDAINKLSTDYKTAIILRDINGLSYEDIAFVTGTNIGTVKSRISRARQSLRGILVNDYNIS